LPELKGQPETASTPAAEAPAAEPAPTPTPASASTPTPAAEEKKKPAPQKVEEVIKNIAEAAKSKPATEEVKKEEPVVTPPKASSGNTDFAELEDKIAAFKEKGNNQFRKKAYKEAVKHFSEAIKLFEDTGRPINEGDIKTKITQIYTNRATGLHLLNQQSSVASDCTFVIESLDPTNKKALYRRAHAYQTQELFEEAARDLQALMQAHGEDDDIKVELANCMKRMVTQKKK